MRFIRIQSTQSFMMHVQTLPCPVLNTALQVRVTASVMANKACRDEATILWPQQKKLIIDALLLGTNFTHKWQNMDIGRDLLKAFLRIPNRTPERTVFGFVSYISLQLWVNPKSKVQLERIKDKNLTLG